VRRRCAFAIDENGKHAFAQTIGFSSRCVDRMQAREVQIIGLVR
jgi:hypothetical protein